MKPTTYSQAEIELRALCEGAESIQERQQLISSPAKHERGSCFVLFVFFPLFRDVERVEL